MRNETRAFIEEGLCASSIIVACLAEMRGHSFIAWVFWFKAGLDMWCVSKAWWAHAKEDTP